MTDSSTPSKKSIPQLMSEYISEAAQLRYEAPKPGDEADQSVLLKALQDYRSRLDRIEYLMVRALLRKREAFNNLKSLQEEQSDKWDESLVNRTSKRTANLVSAQEFVAPREKYAEANIATIEERQATRKAEEIYQWTETASDVLQKMYRGMDSARQDLLARIKAVPVVNSMEYTTS